MSENEIPYGYCHCGCGQKTKIAERTRSERDTVKGEPYRYVRGHGERCAPFVERFWRYLTPGPIDKCWLWSGSQTAGGYGVLNVDGRMTLAHRLSYEIHVAPIGDGLHCLHRCDTPLCCNPHHLFLGTDADNMADKMAKGRYKGGCHPGESSSNHKLTNQSVREIRKLVEQGVTQAEIGRRFQVSESAIAHIVRRRTWTHV